MTVSELRSAYEQQRGRQSQVADNIAGTKTKLIEMKRDLHRHEQAREIVREVGLATQQQLQYHISDITSLALEAVFPDPYALVAEFVERRTKRNAICISSAMPISLTHYPQAEEGLSMWRRLRCGWLPGQCKIRNQITCYC